MAQPVIKSSGDLEPKNLTFETGRWNADLSTPITLVFAVESSGVSSPYVRTTIDWGDGTTLQKSGLQVTLQIQQYTHVYEKVGDYTITVSTDNVDEESSDPMTVPVRIVSETRINTGLARWRGLALPTATIKESVASVNDYFTPEFARLAVNASEGDTQIIIQEGAGLFVGTATVTISQDGKYVSTGRVVSVDQSTVYLDRALKDSYDDTAQVMVQQRAIRGETRIAKLRESDWYFPSTPDRALIRASIGMILSTAPYERPMKTSFGSDVYRIPFEQLDEIAEEELKTAVAGAIRLFEPRVRVQSVSIRENDDDQNSMTLLVTMTEVNDFSSTPFVLDFNTINPEADNA